MADTDELGDYNANKSVIFEESESSMVEDDQPGSSLNKSNKPQKTSERKFNSQVVETNADIRFNLVSERLLVDPLQQNNDKMGCEDE